MASKIEKPITEKVSVNLVVKFSHTTAPIACTHASTHGSFYIHPNTTAFYSTQVTPFEGSLFELKIVSTQGYYGTVSITNRGPVKVRFLKFRLEPGHHEKLDFELEPNGSNDIQNVPFSSYSDQYGRVKFVFDLELFGKHLSLSSLSCSLDFGIKYVHVSYKS
jgi:hypothetical protein